MILIETHAHLDYPDFATDLHDVFRRATEKDPSLPKARYNLGQALEAAGRLEEARPEYEQAIRMRAPFPEAHYALANVLRKLGENEEAREHFAAFRRFRTRHVVKPGDVPAR